MKEAKKVVIGGTYKHISGGLYRVDRVLPDATGYERRGKIGSAIEYTQLYDGQYPSGTVWVRSERDFLRTTRKFPHFLTPVPIFELQSDK